MSSTGAALRDAAVGCGNYRRGTSETPAGAGVSVTYAWGRGVKGVGRREDGKRGASPIYIWKYMCMCVYIYILEGLKGALRQEGRERVHTYIRTHAHTTVAIEEVLSLWEDR